MGKVAIKAKLAEFWKDVFIAAGQVTFGVVAAIWFIPPFDESKQVVLVTNLMATLSFLLFGYAVARKT